MSIAEKNGFLLVNKPSGPTSHDVIDELRRILGTKKIGHAGTLDPFANGLLLVGVGEATKLLRHYVGMDKEYEAVLRLGAVSTTQDRDGKITAMGGALATSSTLKKVLQSFIGAQTQVPPMYSAKKIGGKKLYELARQGKEVERKPVEIEVYDITLLSEPPPSPLLSKGGGSIRIRYRVSSGTYVRTLAHDIGRALGCGAYLEELKRTAIGDFRLTDAVEVDGRLADRIIPLKTVLVSGTFDGVHQGHREYFRQARELGHRLICIVGRDAVVERIKGRPPRRTEKERIKLVKQCPEIDRVYLGVEGSDEDVYDFVAWLSPDVIALGYDQTAYVSGLGGALKRRGLDVAVKKMKPFEPGRFKSSLVFSSQ